MNTEIIDSKPEIKTQEISLADPVTFSNDVSGGTSELVASATEAARAITCHEDYKRAISIGVKIHTRQKMLTAMVEESFLLPARRIKQSAERLMHAVTDPLQKAKESLATATTLYREREEREARIETEKRQAEARRLQAEAEKRAFDARLKAEREEEDARIAAAAEAEKSGDKLRAVQILETPQNIVAPEIEVMAPAPMVAEVVAVEKISGEVRKSTWVGNVSNYKAFMLGLVDGRIPPEAIEIRKSWLNKMAKTFHEKVGQYVPGMSATPESDTSFRS